MEKLDYNPNIKKYKFEQIRDEIIKNIDNGLLKRGESISSILELSETYKTSRVTIDRAYRHLKDQGYINFVRGKGYYVSEILKEEISILLI